MKQGSFIERSVTLRHRRQSAPILFHPALGQKQCQNPFRTPCVSCDFWKNTTCILKNPKPTTRFKMSHLPPQLHVQIQGHIYKEHVNWINCSMLSLVLENNSYKTGNRIFFYAMHQQHMYQISITKVSACNF